MSPEDVALCQQAIDLAQSGHKQEAYQRFCDLYNHGNANDTTILYWIAFTTPSQQEARRAVGDIARLAPEHSSLPDLRAYIERRWSSQQEKEEEQAASQDVWHPPIPQVQSQPQPQQRVPMSGTKLFFIVLLGVAGGILLALCVLSALTPDFWTGFWQGFCGSTMGVCSRFAPFATPTPTPFPPLPLVP